MESLNSANIHHKIQEELVKRNVSLELLNLVTTVNQNSIENSTDDHAFNLCSRISADNLTNNYCQTLSTAYQSFLEAVSAADKSFISNIAECAKADNILGASGNSAKPVDEANQCLKTLKDGTKYLRCPILGCTSGSFKLRRHLKSAHQQLTDFQTTYAIELAKKMFNNSDRKDESLSSTNSPEKTKKRQPNFATRKDNPKRCLLCSKLLMNISDHLMKFHKLDKTSTSYHHNLTNSPTVPKCFTKYVEGELQALKGEELEEAKSSYNFIVTEQANDYKTIQAIKKEMCEKRKQMDETTDSAVYGQNKKLLSELEEKYKAFRYQDKRNYTTTQNVWKETFELHLKRLKFAYPERMVNMALDVLFEYQQKSGENVTFAQLNDAFSMRKILDSFQHKPTLKSVSKQKYIKIFQMFVKFLTLDVSSPEYNADDANEDITKKERNSRLVEFEFASCFELLGKDRGRDLAKAKKRASEKIVPEEEIMELVEDVRGKLGQILEEDLSSGIENYTLKEAKEVRDKLILVAASRLGQRSKELMKMTLTEVEEAEEERSREDTYHIVKVFEQKGVRGGNFAAVPFQEMEFVVLKLFIRKLRPKISNDPTLDVVFPALHHLNNTTDKELSFSSIYKILNRFTTRSGIKLSSRILRRSKVTNSRAMNITEEQRREMALAMNHSVATADRYYDYNSVNSSIIKAIDMNNSTVTSSPKTSTPVKRPPEPEESLDDTLKTLRSKKIKNSIASDTTKLILEIRDVIENLILKGELDLLKTKTGKISIQPVTKALSKNTMRLHSIAIIRKCIEDALKDFEE